MVIGIECYCFCVIINQGILGGYDLSLKVGDIVIGKCFVNVSNFKMLFCVKGEGLVLLEWLFMDLFVLLGSVGEGDLVKDVECICYYLGLLEFIVVVYVVKYEYECGKVVEGIIVSGNFWNNEVDCIVWLYN